MSNPIQWSEGSTSFCLLASGQDEEFYSFVKKHLTGDFYSSLELAREAILANPEFEEVEFCLCVAFSGVLYALVGGGATLSLVREGKTIPLLKTLSGTASLVSGNIATGDAFELKTSTSEYVFFAQPEKPSELAAGGFRDKIAGFIDTLLSKLPERRIVVQGIDSNSRAKKASIIGVLFLVILGISVYFGVQRRADVLRREEYEPRLAAAQHDFEEARELAPISRARARELIIRAHQSVKELESAGVEDQKLTELAADISEYLGIIAGIYEFPAELFFDLTIVASGFEGADIALSGGELRILDSKGRRLVGMEVDGKRTNVIAGPDYLPDAVAIAAYENRSFILSSDGIREVTEDVELVVKPDWDADNVLVEAFAGNLYVLDRGNNQIWRYQGVTGGFLEKDEWLGEGFTIDVSEAVSLAIDGSIWTISQAGEFKVYSLGAPASFSVSGNSQPFSGVADLYTDEASNFVYVLDSGNTRISIVGKSGEYMGEYTAPELGKATALVVDEEAGLMLFLAESKLYAIDAKHLENESN